MPDKKELVIDDIGAKALAEAPVKRPFLGANSRTASGAILFAEVGATMNFRCIAVEPFAKDGRPQAALILMSADGTELIRPLGVSNERQLRALGCKVPNDAIGKVLTFRSYKTGSKGAFEYGIEIISAVTVKK